MSYAADATRIRTLTRAANALTVVAFVCFFAFTLSSNQFDWDHFLTAAEVDFRSWMLDGTPPLWSYQLCGGVTRAGDPQAFGLSPLFAVVLLLGSFWGLKFGLLLLTLLGWWGMNGILATFYAGMGRPARPGRVASAVVRAISLAFVLGNYFLWHAHHGHVTVALNFVALAMLRCLLEAFFHGPAWPRAALGAALGWSYFSAGFYHSLVFFLLPLAAAIALWAGLALGLPALRRLLPKGALGRATAMLGACGLGLLAAGYKLSYVWTYQQSNPRTATPPSSGAVDGAGLLQTLTFQLAPTFDYRFLGVFRGWGPFGIWEYSAFSLDSWVCLVGLGFLAFSRKTGPTADRTPGRWRLPGLLAGCTAAIGFAFALGDRVPLSAHRLLNHVLHDSVRVTGRYQVLFSLAIAWTATILLARHRGFRTAFVSIGLVAVPLLTIANLLTFRATLRPASSREVLAVEPEPVKEMQWVTEVSPRTADRSFMYPAARRGLGVLNCYDPISRVSVISREFIGRPELMDAAGRPRGGATLPLVDPERGHPPQSCLEESHFTQSALHLAPSCGPGTCVNLNGLSVYDPPGLVFSESVGKFCVPPTP